MKNGIIWTRDKMAQEVMCVPREKQLVTKLVMTAHELLGHYGSQRTEEYLRRYCWWLEMAKTTKEFCRTCEACQQAKVPNQWPAGKLHLLPVPTKPWYSIGMDFIGPFPESKEYD